MPEMTSRRTLHRILDDASLRIHDDGDGRTLLGVAVPYGEPATISDPIEGRYTESFRQGAFAKSIRERGDRIALNLLHDSRGRLPIGRSLRLAETDHGLIGAWRVSQTAAGDEVLALVADGVPVGLSIGFTPLRDRWSRDRTSVERIEAKLEEVSVVNRPAYAGATVTGLRAMSPGDVGPLPAAAARARLTAAARITPRKATP